MESVGGRYVLFIVNCYLLIVVCCLSLVNCYLLIVVCCLSLVICYLLFVGCSNQLLTTNYQLLTTN
ncbi:hypothetical protein CEN44_13095 [Fischerella muscicola CCMEE 5323]|uniref:Uncharacterized protein n=1 Tax=Fischerella muscicola CCMEE 5323 TaxID=2019572 RepID=A0A2N6K2R9_FISMU|nr:hypothetical protein CEN44_13095 [Fischerella muscicola CCMEE 5323]